MKGRPTDLPFFFFILEEALVMISTLLEGNKVFVSEQFEKEKEIL